MKILVISDVHANLEALEAVEKTVDTQQIDQVWFLGDIPDRGPDPVKVLEWLNSHVEPENWVLGNHDSYLLRLAKARELQGVDERVIKTNNLQRQEILESGIDLGKFQQASDHPLLKKIDGFTFILTHGSPADPVGHERTLFSWTSETLMEDEYHALQALINQEEHEQVVCFTAHTHIPFLISMQNSSTPFTMARTKITYGKCYELENDDCWFINPGSVGSPRDLDDRAACAVLDTGKNTLQFHRIVYDINLTAKKLLEKNYDPIWVKRIYEATPPEHVPGEWLDHFKQIRTFNYAL